MRVFLLILMFWACWKPLCAQDSALPSRSYFVAKTIYYDGEYADALKEFQSEWRGSFKISTNRWIDAICFATMMGECHYQMGQYPEALDQYTSAVQLFLQYYDWMTRINNVPNPGNARFDPCPWGDAKPNRQIMKVPDKFSLIFGDPNYNTRNYKSGDTIAPPSLRSVCAEEIVRCTCLSIRRRGELLGPLAAGDDLNTKLLAKLPVLGRSMGGSWLQAWVDIQMGVTQIACGKETEGIQSLMRGALVGGADHPFTCLVHLTLGEISLRSANYDKALTHFLEAATLAFYYDDAHTIDDAFRGLANAYYQKNPAQVCPVFLAADVWAKKEKIAFLRVPILTYLADEYLRKNQLPQAGECIAEADRTIGRRTMGGGLAGARVHFMRARVAFRDPTPASQKLGFQAIQTSMHFMRAGSVWNFRIALVDTQLLAGRLTPRKANEAYEILIHDPTAAEWALNPMESLALLMTPRPVTWENWFLVAMEMEKTERALEIAEMARRARFLQTLDFGGRMHALRLLMELPEEHLTVTQRQRRRDIQTEYPGYDVRSEKVRELQGQIRAMSLPVTQKEEEQKLSQWLKELAVVSQQQESFLAAMVLDKRLIDLVFPPLKTFKEIQEGLAQGEAMLVFFAARNQMFCFLLNRERFTTWVIRDRGAGRGSSRTAKNNDLTSLQNNLALMLREIGMTGAGTPIKGAKLKETTWKEHSLRVMADLTKSSQADFSRSDFSSLVIVPDRFTWYLPFEILQVQTPKGLRPTINQFAIRYAPTASLGVPWKPVVLPTSPYAIVAYGKESPSEEMLEKLSAAVTRPVEFEPKSFGGMATGTPYTVSSNYVSVFDKMVVLEDLKNDFAEPYFLTPLGVDAVQQGSRLAQWFAFPHGVPRLIFLTGFHTMTESLGSTGKRGTKKAPVMVPGQELFLTSMAMLANGCDVLVLSRWRMGGNSSCILASEFLEQLKKNENVSQAWRRAVLKLAGTKLDLAAEPRIVPEDETQTSVRGTNPVFWGGYMLVGSGQKWSDDPTEETVNDDDVPEIVVPQEE
ncbi:MAG: CHAT domain-containing protein [Planctomycetia bacterium]|nr:CHAT domain-containing protein [Planctomycetia bacterium]